MMEVDPFSMSEFLPQLAVAMLSCMPGVGALVSSGTGAVMILGGFIGYVGI